MQEDAKAKSESRAKAATAREKARVKKEQREEAARSRKEAMESPIFGQIEAYQLGYDAGMSVSSGSKSSGARKK